MDTSDSGQVPPPPPPYAPPPAAPAPPAPPPAPPAGPPQVRQTTMPTGRAALRAGVAPLTAYGIALAVALVLMVFLVIGLAIADGGGDSDPSDEIDIKVIGTLIGIPFQIVAMALGGSLGFDDTDWDISLFAPPLFVTGAFLVALFRLSRRAERAAPAASTVERAVLAVAGTVLTAVVALALTRLLAMRDDETVMHAAGFGLFFGIVLVGGTVAFLGRQAAVTSLWPRWLPVDGRRSIHLVTQHLLVGTLVLIPVAALWFLVDSGVEAALFVLVWGPAVGLAAFGLGHLGGLTAAGDTEFAWDLGWFPGIVLPLIAVVLAVVAAVAWHLRRGEDRALLQHPGSWVALPASYAAAGLGLCLVSSVGIHSEVFDGGLWFHIAYWLVPVLALWGAAIEALSRFVAPSLVGALPSGVARRLARGPAHLVSAPTGPVQQIPMSPADAARAKKALIGAGIVGGVALIGGIALSILGSTVYGPESRAEAYLDAVVDGDADLVLDLGPVDEDEASTDLLTNDIYGETEDRITGYDITDIDTNGDLTTVTVDLEGVDGGDDVELVLESDGRRGVFFRDWQVADGGLASTVNVTLPDGTSTLQVNGTTVDTDDDDFWALPGSYEFNPYGDSEWLDSSGARTTITPGYLGNYAEFETPQASEELRSFVTSEIETWVSECMASTQLDPEGCPQSAFGYGDKIRNVVWTLTADPTVDWDYFSGTFPADLSTATDGAATVTYEYDASYGYGRADWTKETDDDTFYMDATLDLVDGEPVVTFDTD